MQTPNKFIWKGFRSWSGKPQLLHNPSMGPTIVWEWICLGSSLTCCHQIQHPLLRETWALAQGPADLPLGRNLNLVGQRLKHLQKYLQRSEWIDLKHLEASPGVQLSSPALLQWITGVKRVQQNSSKISFRRTVQLNKQKDATWPT